MAHPDFTHLKRFARTRHALEIDVPLEEVWNARTEAREIEHWFAPKMSVEPAVGGTVTADWVPGLQEERH